MIELNIRLMTRVTIVDQLHTYIENDSRAKLISRADQKLRKTGRSKQEQKKEEKQKKDSDGKLNFQERIYNQNPTTTIVSKTCVTNQQHLASPDSPIDFIGL